MSRRITSILNLTGGIKKMKAKEIEKLAVGNIYYKQSKYDCTSCYKVQVLEILNDKEVLVKGTKKTKRGKEPKPFKTYISTLHTTPKKAVGGYRQHH